MDTYNFKVSGWEWKQSERPWKSCINFSAAWFRTLHSHRCRRLGYNWPVHLIQSLTEIKLQIKNTNTSNSLPSISLQIISLRYLKSRRWRERIETGTFKTCKCKSTSWTWIEFVRCARWIGIKTDIKIGKKNAKGHSGQRPDVETFYGLTWPCYDNKGILIV